MKRQLSLFMAFLRVGIFGYGGGPSMIPLVHKEVVEKFNWMDDKEFSDLLALANALPGPIATKMAGYIGYRVSGVTGMISAVMATILPTILAMILLLTSLSALSHRPWVKGMTSGVMPVVGVMLAVLTWDFFNKGREGLGWTKGLILVAVTLLLVVVFSLPPAILIFALLLFALIKPVKRQAEEQADSQEGSG